MVKQQFPKRVVSGGQTGVDRGALDAAIELGIPHGGWCPRGRLAEDGPIPGRYQLKETRSARYSARTRQNVLDSTGTLILFVGEINGGTKLTAQLAARHAMPCLTIDLHRVPDAREVRAWLEFNGIEVLNVAGPRESSTPGIHAKAHAFVLEVLGGGGGKGEH